MDELQFQMIVKIITNGAPALANELCTALMATVQANAELESKVKELEAKIADMSKPVEAPKVDKPPKAATKYQKPEA